MSTYWKKTYADLPKGWYSAEVRNHTWDGWFVFLAYPARGDICTEFMSKDKDECIRKAEAWMAAGCDASMVPGLYASSF